MNTAAGRRWAGSLDEALAVARDPSAPGDRRSDAAGVVHEQLRRYASKWRGVEEDELVAQAWVRALTKDVAALARPPSDPQREPEVRSWLKTVVGNLANDVFRQRKRRRQATPDELEEIPQPASDTETKEEEAAAGERALEVVRSAFERAREDCINDEVRTEFNAAWGEVTALVEGTVTVETLLAAFVGTPEFVRRRDALYKRHERARKRVLAACGAVKATGTITEEDIVRARSAVEGYFRRRQIRPGRASEAAKA